MRVFNILVLIAAMGLFTACSNGKAETNSKANNDVKTEEMDVQSPATTAVEATESAKVVHLNTQMFIDQIFDYKSSPTKWVYKGDKPAIIDFYADWCGPCKRVAPIMEQLAGEYAGQINIYKVNTDEERELAGQVFGIRSIPSILYIPVEGQPTMYTGAFPKERYVELINEILLKK
jgi:thioredoxin